MKPTRHLSRRKGSARATHKKLRAGVTRRQLSQLTQQELFRVFTALRLLPADVVKQIGKRHPLLIPPFTNDTLRRAVEDYVGSFARRAAPSSKVKTGFSAVSRRNYERE